MLPVLPKLNTFNSFYCRAQLLNSQVKCDHCRYCFCRYPACVCKFPMSIAWSGVCSYKGTCDGNQLEICMCIFITMNVYLSWKTEHIPYFWRRDTLVTQWHYGKPDGPHVTKGLWFSFQSTHMPLLRNTHTEESQWKGQTMSVSVSSSAAE